LGTVINSVTGEPVRRAAVQVSGQNSNVALTDAGGHFVLEGLSEGNVFLTPMKPGFSAEDGSNTPAQVGNDAPAVVLKLTPWAAIEGRVITKDDLPLEGLPVHLFAKQNVTVLPGSYLARPAADGSGNPGAGRVRISLVPSVTLCVEAAQRMREFILHR